MTVDNVEEGGSGSGPQLRGAIFDLRLRAEDKALPVVLEELVAMHGEMSRG